MFSKKIIRFWVTMLLIFSLLMNGCNSSKVLDVSSNNNEELSFDKVLGNSSDDSSDVVEANSQAINDEEPDEMKEVEKKEEGIKEETKESSNVGSEDVICCNCGETFGRSAGVSNTEPGYDCCKRCLSYDAYQYLMLANNENYVEQELDSQKRKNLLVNLTCKDIKNKGENIKCNIRFHEREVRFYSEGLSAYIFRISKVENDTSGSKNKKELYLDKDGHWIDFSKMNKQSEDCKQKQANSHFGLPRCYEKGTMRCRCDEYRDELSKLESVAQGLAQKLYDEIKKEKKTRKSIIVNQKTNSHFKINNGETNNKSYRFQIKDENGLDVCIIKEDSRCKEYFTSTGNWRKYTEVNLIKDRFMVEDIFKELIRIDKAKDEEERIFKEAKKKTSKSGSKKVEKKETKEK